MFLWPTINHWYFGITTTVEDQKVPNCFALEKGLLRPERLSKTLVDRLKPNKLQVLCAFPQKCKCEQCCEKALFFISMPECFTFKVVLLSSLEEIIGWHATSPLGSLAERRKKVWNYEQYDYSNDGHQHQVFRLLLPFPGASMFIFCCG